ncbi:MAG: Ig-like domain-containing protein [Kofleriaceae bacterium]
MTRGVGRLLWFALVFAPAVAAARPQTITVNRIPFVRPAPASAAPPSSRIIYLRRCPDGGCPVRFGPDDDSRSDISSLASGQRTIGKFSRGDAVWTAMVECVKRTYRPFDILVTDVDPGNVPHFEHIVGGKPSDLHPDLGSNVGGVSPFTCAEIPNAITYTFDVWGDQPDTICDVVAQETAHAFGLEHELNEKDPLTYLQGPSPKRFQADAANCGEDFVRACECGNTNQTSYQHIVDIFGPGVPIAPEVTINAPSTGKRVQPHFVTRVDAIDDTKVTSVELYVDGVKLAETTGTAGQTDLAFRIVAPDGIAEGPHAIEVRAIDIQGTIGSATSEIDMGPPCTAAAGCEGEDVCVMGGCVAGPDTPGGLGNFCQANTECLSNQCVADSAGDRFCTEPCDLSAGSCPSGFSCIAAGAAGVCWPDEDGGCCETGGSGGGPAMLGLGVLALVVRRRRR